jgi:molybdate-binding protein
MRISNRPPGTGTRLLLDLELKKAGLKETQIKGYEREFRGHLDVGLEVLAGRADAAPGIKAVAGLLGLDFISLAGFDSRLAIQPGRSPGSGRESC